MSLGHGTTAGLLTGALHRLHAGITRHPARWTVPHRPGRHFPRYLWFGYPGAPTISGTNTR
jgi:hypothetical protein